VVLLSSCSVLVPKDGSIRHSFLARNTHCSRRPLRGATLRLEGEPTEDIGVRDIAGRLRKNDLQLCPFAVPTQRSDAEITYDPVVESWPIFAGPALEATLIPVRLSQFQLMAGKTTVRTARTLARALAPALLRSVK
jgi:hypothetical protein